MTKNPTFADFSDAENDAVVRVLDRAERIYRDITGEQIDRFSLHMDLAACHASRPLRLEELAEADDVNLAHDVFGIIKHMDRETGELGGCFVPRYSVAQQ